MSRKVIKNLLWTVVIITTSLIGVLLLDGIVQCFIAGLVFGVWVPMIDEKINDVVDWIKPRPLEKLPTLEEVKEYMKQENQMNNPNVENVFGSTKENKL